MRTELGGLLAAVLLLLLCKVEGCPDTCVCKWRNGKVTAECANRALSTVPKGLNVETQVLDLNQNKFNVLTNRMFQEKGLTNLQRIFLHDCQIRDIERDAFYHLTNLIELDLSKNYISKIDDILFQYIPNLRKLHLSANPITALPDSVFSNVPELTSLDLSECRIESINVGSFKGLKKLESLKLNSNLLAKLSIRPLQEVPKLFSLHLYNNPWVCDCNLRQLREWLFENNIPLNIPPRCEGPPKLQGHYWDEFGVEELMCPPMIMATNNEAHVIAGSNVTFHCQAWGAPQPDIRWSLNNQILTPNKRTENYVISESHSNNNRSSNLLVIHANKGLNGIYVCNASNPAGYQVVRFNLTIAGMESIKESITQSDYTYLTIILVVTLLLVIAGTLFAIFFFRSKARGKREETKKEEPSNFNDEANLEKPAITMESPIALFEKPAKLENGSSGYGSDHPTPDLVAKLDGASSYIPALQNVYPQESSEMYHQESQNFYQANKAASPQENAFSQEPWRDGGRPLAIQQRQPQQAQPQYAQGDQTYQKFEEEVEPPLHLFEPQYNYPQQQEAGLPPSNNRVQALRNVFEGPRSPAQWKRSPLVLRPEDNHFLPPAQTRFSPDEGYVEALEGTEV